MRKGTYKPIMKHKEIEAAYWDGSSDVGMKIASWVVGYKNGDVGYFFPAGALAHDLENPHIVIHQEGNQPLLVNEGQWVIRNLSGRFSAIDNETFLVAYEAV